MWMFMSGFKEALPGEEGWWFPDCISCISSLRLVLVVTFGISLSMVVFCDYFFFEVLPAFLLMSLIGIYLDWASLFYRQPQDMSKCALWLVPQVPVNQLNSASRGSGVPTCCRKFCVGNLILVIIHWGCLYNKTVIPPNLVRCDLTANSAVCTWLGMSSCMTWFHGLWKSSGAIPWSPWVIIIVKYLQFNLYSYRYILGETTLVDSWEEKRVWL